MYASTQDALATEAAYRRHRIAQEFRRTGGGRIRREHHRRRTDWTTR